MRSGPVPVLEIGGTHVEAALADPSTGEVKAPSGAARRVRLDGRAPAEEIVALIAGCGSALGAPAGAHWGVAVPGPFDYPSGVARFAGVGKFESLFGLDLGAALRAALRPAPSRVSFLNDADAFLLGEWLCGAAAGRGRVAGLTLGTGVGSAFLADGAAVNDGPDVPPEGSAHLLEFAGRPLEETVSRRAMRARYAQLALDDPDVVPDVHTIAELARGGDAAAVRVFDEAFDALGRTIGPWLARFGAEAVVVGGSMAASWDLIAPRLSAALGGGVPLLQPSRPADAALLGAAGLVAASA